MINIENPRIRSGNPCITSRRGGFTLIELLVVLAVTSILLVIIFKPLTDSFALTSRASTQIQSQAAARDSMRQVATLLSNAVYVYDNSGLTRPNSVGPNTSLNLWLRDSAGNPILINSRFSMVEYVAPARQQDQSPRLDAMGNSIQPIDPTTGQPIYDDPTQPPGQKGYAYPLSASRSLGRLFTALINNASIMDTHAVNTAANPFDAVQNGMPSRSYGNEYEDARTINSDVANRYTLYNAEVPVFVNNPFAKTSGTYVPNLGLFHIKDKNGVVDDSIQDYLDPTIRTTQNLHLSIHDPNFFYDNSLAGGDGDVKWAMPGWKDINGDGKVEIWENWRAVSTSLLAGTSRKIDLVTLDRDPQTNNIIYYDNNGVATNGLGRPNVRPLIKFSPAFVQNDSTIASAVDSAGNEAPSSVSTLFSAQYNHWATPFRVLVYRNGMGQDPLNQMNLEYYEMTEDGRIVHVPNLPQGSAGPDPSGLMDVGPRIDPIKGIFQNNNPEFAFTVDSERGTINFSFPSNVMIHDANGNPLTSVYNPGFVNARYFNPDPTVTRNNRYVDLRFLDPVPYNPVSATSPLTPANNAQWVRDARVVPGSETIFGPDQIHGPHYGYHTQYSRVSGLAGSIGPNQYKINYVDIPNNVNPNDPGQSKGYIEFDSFPDIDSTTLDRANVTDDPMFGGMFNPAVGFKPHSMPEHKANPNYNPAMGNTAANPLLLSLPSDPVEVAYKFQVNRPNDVIKVDYLTRELMTVAMEMRLYDQTSGRPQSTVLTQQIKIQNFQK